MILKRGDFIWVENAKQRVKAMVVLASSNGRSVMVMFDAAFWTEGGMYAGTMPLLLEEDGQFYELVSHEVVRVSRMLEKA